MYDMYDKERAVISGEGAQVSTTHVRNVTHSLETTLW